MKHLFGFILLSFLLSLAFGQKKPVIVERIHLHESPSASSKIVQTLSLGDTVIFVSEDGDWSRVVKGTDYGWMLSISLGPSAQEIRQRQRAAEPKRTHLPPPPPRDLSVASTDYLFENNAEFGSFVQAPQGERYIPGAGFESEVHLHAPEHSQPHARTGYTPYTRRQEHTVARVPEEYIPQQQTDHLVSHEDRDPHRDIRSPHAHAPNRFGYQEDIEDETARFGYQQESVVSPARPATQQIELDVPVSQREMKTSTFMATEREPMTTENISYNPDWFTGTGIGYPEFTAMTGKMMRDILACPVISNRAFPPRVIIDATDFRNESSQPLNLNLITDDLRTQLVRGSAGRILFVAREFVKTIEEERSLHATGRTSPGYYNTRRPAGADFKLAGRIVSQNITDPQTNRRANYFLFTFELIDLNNGFIVWSNNYRTLKEGEDTLIYE